MSEQKHMYTLLDKDGKILDSTTDPEKAWGWYTGPACQSGAIVDRDGGQRWNGKNWTPVTKPPSYPWQWADEARPDIPVRPMMPESEWNPHDRS